MAAHQISSTVCVHAWLTGVSPLAFRFTSRLQVHAPGTVAPALEDGYGRGGWIASSSGLNKLARSLDRRGVGEQKLKESVEGILEYSGGVEKSGRSSPENDMVRGNLDKGKERKDAKAAEKAGVEKEVNEDEDGEDVAGGGGLGLHLGTSQQGSEAQTKSAASPEPQQPLPQNGVPMSIMDTF